LASKYSSSYWGGVNVKGRCSFACFSACWCSNLARSLRMSAGDLPEDEREYTADRKSTRLNSSYLVISYAVFCLKKKKKKKKYHNIGQKRGMPQKANIS